MTAYAIGHLHPAAHPGEGVLTYIERIQSTMDPFGGRFLVHGTQVEVVEGDWPGALVIIGFPDLAAARGWYESAAYQELLPLRTRNMAGDVVLVEGVGPEYDASATAAAMRARPAGHQLTTAGPEPVRSADRPRARTRHLPAHPSRSAASSARGRGCCFPGAGLCRKVSASAVFAMITTASATAPAGWPTRYSPKAPPPSTTTSTASTPASGSRIRARGAANSPHRVMASAGIAKAASSFRVVLSPPVRKPHQDRQTSAANSSTNARPSLAAHQGRPVGQGSPCRPCGNRASVPPRRPRLRAYRSGPRRWPTTAGPVGRARNRSEPSRVGASG